MTSHRAVWNTWNSRFQRVPESKWSGAEAAINKQKELEKSSLGSLRKSRTFRLHKSSFRFRLSALAAALPLGISSFLTQFAIVLTSGVFNALLVVYGADSAFGSDIPIAVMGIVMKVFAICVSVSIGLAVGAQPIVGYNYSAGIMSG